MKYISILFIVIFLGGCQKANGAKLLQIQSIKNGKVVAKKIHIKSVAGATRYKTSSNDTTATKVKNYIYQDGSKFNSKSDILIKFKDDIETKEFETKYNLKFKKKLTTGDMVFENRGLDSLLTINKIINDMPNNIKRIQPNKVLNMSPR